MATCAIPRPEHPNPQWQRKHWKNLNGTWQFEIDYSCSGEERGLPEAESLCGTITVPFCPESKLSGVAHKDFMNCVWYKKEIILTEADLLGKQSARYDSYRAYYTRTTGIWQTVWYEIVPESYIRYARLTPDLENGTLSIDAELSGTGDFTAAL